uniref:Uncharacterized protein n=1 Tax=viral metagenome TaxID=1070528 RepID=A0A6C0E744_9ZZZZ
MNGNFRNLIFWKWSIGDGEHMERSLRKYTKIYTELDNEISDNAQKQIQPVTDEDIENMAYTQSIQCDSINWSDTNDIMFLEHQCKLASNNKREESYNKMAEREMVSQIGLNPFLHKNVESQNNDTYIQDVVNRDLFMKPANTNIEKPITETENNNLY